MTGNGYLSLLLRFWVWWLRWCGKRFVMMIRNTLADALAMLDRYVVRCRWHWLCELPSRLWILDLDSSE